MTARSGSVGSPSVRLALGAIGMAVTEAFVHDDGVGPREAKAFRLVNDLPDSLFVPAWLLMQLGTIGAVPLAAGAAAPHDRRLARRLLVAGVATWALSKVVKGRVRRPRPAGLIADARRRGPDASGLGYLSGHAGVAVAMGVAVAPHLGHRGRLATAVLVPIVGLSRIYVAAHLPLDVVGGACLGLAVDAAVELAQQQ